MEENFEGFECPISFDTERPCLLFKKGDGVLLNVERKQLDSIMERPYEILEDPVIVKAIADRIGSVIGMTSVKRLQESHKDPFHGVEFSSCITIGSDISHEKMNRRALADLLFGTKLVGIYENWLGVLYAIFKNMEYFKDDEYRAPFWMLSKNILWIA